MADHSNLPAPYESPWRQLARALQAVLASLGLDLRGLWRRNRSGELLRPSWWPRDLAPLFWPLLLAGVVTLLVTAGLGLGNRPQSTPAPAALSQEEPQQDAPAPGPAEAPWVDPADEPTIETAPQPSAEPAAESAPLPPPTATEPPEAAVPTPSDALLQSLQGDERPALISSARVMANGSVLEIQLNAAYSRLDPRRQRRLAETWLERSLDLGYEQLELIDSQNRSVGHRARVGSGMILLDPDAEH